MNADRREIDAVLAALADPTRRRLLDVLAEEGRASATVLAARLPVSRQAVVKHLRILEDAELVAGSRAGREVRYQVRPQPLDASSRWFAALAANWDRRLTALRRAAEPDAVASAADGDGAGDTGNEADADGAGPDRGDRDRSGRARSRATGDVTDAGRGAARAVGGSAGATGADGASGADERDGR